ncbi:Uma2 family endonuclease [Streptomyces echinatus]|uniref:Uma2 family endonuclease n=1 Tax=Streptomyces echinatus TaxID=67293 RepID=UPI00380DF1FD
MLDLTVDEYEGDYLLTGDAWEELVWVWQRTDVPRGCKTEIIDGTVTVAPYSAVAHHALSEPLQRRLYEVLPQSWHVLQGLALAVPSRSSLYVPDLVVVPEAAERSRDDDSFVPGAAELVVEITSTVTARRDRGTKAAGYAEAGVPLYLLVDGSAPDGPHAVRSSK